MRKFCSLLAVVLLMAISASAMDLPYSSGSFTADNTAKGEVNDGGWSYKDYGVADSSWTNATNFPYNGMTPLRLGANTYYQVSDIWLVSPRFNVKKGNDYTITFYTKSQAALNSTSFDAYFTDKSPVAGEDNATATAATTPVAFGGSFTTTYSLRTATFTANKNGEYYIALRFQGQHGTPVFIADVNITETDNGGGEEEEPEPEHECAATITSIPYSSLLSDGSTFDDGWTVINVEENSNTWQPTTDYDITSRQGAKYTYDSNYDADDYLISPSIHMDKGEEYIISYGYKASYSNERMEIVASLSPDISDPIVIQTQGTVSSYTKYSPVFTPEHTGDYYIAFHAISPRDKLNIYVGDFIVARATDKNPKSVTGLKAEPAPNRELKVTLSWTNPTADIFDRPVTLTKIEVYRDNAESPLATLGGTVTSYIDTTLEAGEHTYTVIAYAGDLASGAAKVSTPWIGPLAPKPVPAAFAINSQDDFNNFTTIVGENSTAVRHWIYNSSYGSQMTGASGQTEDDWLISPPIAVDEAGLYKVIVNAKVETPAYPSKIQIRLGQSSTPEGLTTLVAELTEGLTNSLKDFEYNVQISDPGTYYIAVYGCYDGDGRQYAQHYYVKSVGIEKSVALPGIATDLTVTPDESKLLEATISWTNPTETDVEGVSLTDGDITKAVIYRDGTEIAAVEDGDQLIPGQTGSYTDSELPEGGEYTYKVEIYTANGKSKTAPAEATAWVGPGMLISPDGTVFTGTDFADWTKSNADGGFGGWYYSSGQLEFYRYASATSVDDWFVSPRLEFEKNKLYKVEVSSYEYSYGSDGDYRLCVHIGQESDHTQMPQLGSSKLINLTRGTTQGNMQVDTFYVSTKVDDPDAIAALDDEAEEGSEENPIMVDPGTMRLALHGDEIPANDVDFYLHQVKITGEDISTGIDTAADAGDAFISADIIRFEGRASVAVYNVAGALVASDTKASGSFDISGLNDGLYIITITLENGKTTTLKTVK